MLKIASGLLSAQIASTVLWISSWKLYFSFAEAAWLRSRRSRHGALAGPRRIAGASFGTLTGRRCEAHWRGGQHSPLLLAAGADGGAGSTGAALLNSSHFKFADVPPEELVRTKPRCALQARDVAIEVAQHFEKIVVKSVFGEVWFRRDR